MITKNMIKTFTFIQRNRESPTNYCTLSALALRKVIMTSGKKMLKTMTMKPLTLLFALTLTVTAVSCSQNQLDDARRSRLKQATAALAAGDAGTLAATLSSEEQSISKEDAGALLKKVTSVWGDLNACEEIIKADLVPPLDKGDMHVLAHWGNLSTRDGEWMLFGSPDRPNHYMRVGLLFGPGSEYVGQFIVCEFPQQKENIKTK